MPSSLTDRAFVLLQHLLPQHALSALMFRLARCRNPGVVQQLIRLFSRIYGVDLGEAAEPDAAGYETFNAFFTRALKPGARPLAETADAIVCPADGRISQIGRIDGAAILQAKGQSFDVATLLGGDPELAAPFLGGRFATVYLSPKDYHRLHMPTRGRIRKMVYIPGRLFSVNDATAALVPGLFARNERVLALFDTEVGPMVMVLVGAIFVGSIETVWHGMITPYAAQRAVHLWDYGRSGQWLARGDEMGRFNMGSTVIVLFGPGSVDWTTGLCSGTSVRMGQCIGAVAA